MRGIIEVNDFVVWADAIEVGDGLKTRLSFNDWRQLHVISGQVISVRLPGRSEMRLSIANVTETPPNVLVSLTASHAGGL